MKSGTLNTMAFFAFSAIVVFGLSGCPGEVKSVRGYAMLDTPLAGATVRLIDESGAQIWRARNTTGERGTFFLNVPERLLPDSFLIEVSGGSAKQGAPFDGVLKAFVSAHDEGHSFYEVNVVTTLAEAFHAARPEFSYAEAEAKVKAHLEIPPHIDIRNDLVHSDIHFADELFMRELDQSGGWQPFFDALAAELENPSESHPFTWHAAYPPDQEKAGMGATLGKALLKGVASGIGSAIGGQLAGWALNAIFGGDDANPSVSPEQFQSSMNDIEGKLDGLTQAVGQLQQQLSADVQQILVGQEQQTFNTVAALLSQDTAVVESLHERLSWLADAELDGQTGLASDVNDFVGRIDAADLLTVLNHTHNVLIGAVPGQQGLLELWGDVLFAKSYSAKHFDLLNDQMNYWMSVQVQALNLLVESDHYHYPQRPRYAANYLNTYLKNMADQVEVYYQAVEKQITLFRRLDETSAATANFDGYDPYGTGSITSVFYTDENHTLFDAQSFAAGAQDQDGGTMIWVQMFSYFYLYNWGNFPATNLSGPGKDALKLRNIATGQIYTPQTAAFHFYDQTPWFPALVINPGAGDKTTQVGRYDFGTLPPGRYQLTSDFNNAFPHTPKKPLPKTYLDFVINVDASNPIHNMLILFGGQSLNFG